MASKRVHDLHLTLSDEEAQRVDEYIAFAKAQHIDIARPEAIRSLMGRGYLAWRGETTPVVKRKTPRMLK